MAEMLLGNEKKGPWLFVGYMSGMKHYPSIWGLWKKTPMKERNAYEKQAGFHGK